MRQRDSMTTPPPARAREKRKPVKHMSEAALLAQRLRLGRCLECGCTVHKADICVLRKMRLELEKK